MQLQCVGACERIWMFERPKSYKKIWEKKGQYMKLQMGHEDGYPSLQISFLPPVRRPELQTWIPLNSHIFSIS